MSGLRFALALASGHARDTNAKRSALSESEGQFTLGNGKVSTERLRVEVRNGSFEVESLRLIWYAEKTGTRLFRFMQAGAVRLPIHARARLSASPLTSHPHRSHGRVYLDALNDSNCILRRPLATTHPIWTYGVYARPMRIPN